MPEVSVVVPVYNVEKYLRACLDSILTQTLRDIEIIAIDDHSPDHCGEILDMYSLIDERIKVFHLPENRHQGYGRNFGIDHALGKYIYLIDSDDMLEKNALQILYETAEKDALDGIMFDSSVIYENSGLEKKFLSYPGILNGNYENRIFSGADFFDELVQNDDWTCYIQRQFWKRNYLVSNCIRFPEGSEHEDEVFSFKAFLLAKRMRHLSEKFFIRRFREDSVMTRPVSPKDFYGYLVCFYEMTKFVNRYGVKNKSTDYVIGRLFFLVREYYEKFKNQCDLKSYIRREEIKDLFEMYEAVLDADEAFYRGYVSGCISEAKSHKSVYLYGAGLIAKRVYQGLAANGVAIEGFIVSAAAGNPEALYGRRVIPIDDFSPAESDVIVIISVTIGYWKEIENLLKSKGIPYAFYKKR